MESAPRNLSAKWRCFGLMLAGTLAQRAHPIQATKRVTPRMSWIAAFGMSSSGDKSKKFSTDPDFLAGRLRRGVCSGRSMPSKRLAKPDTAVNDRETGHNGQR